MEIGSEFWLENIPLKKDKILEDNRMMLFLSGRTAIDYALEIIEHHKEIKSVYFPSYCCQSMINPFLERKIKVEFYAVKFENGNFLYDIDCNKSCDIFFAMNYFGFNQYNMDYYIEKFRERNICVIEDSTHSILSKRKYNLQSDFVVVSLRKWFPIISGGILLKQSAQFNSIDNTVLKYNIQYINLKEHAMKEKANYILGIEKNNKERFLKEFAETEKILDADYKNYSIDIKSYNILKNINMEYCIRQRKRNAKLIYEYLKKQNKFDYLKKVDLEADTPLFVPIFLPNEQRDELKKFLIENEVYCPNHWQIPNQIIIDTQQYVYNIELSLICDQRYTEENIKKYIELLKLYEIN